MFNQLLESRAVHTRRPGGTLVSIAAHTLLVGALVAATANATVPADRERREQPVTLATVSPPPSEPARARVTPRASDRPAPPSNSLAPILPVPVDIPSVIPDTDLSRAPTDPRDFDSGARGGSGGVPGGTGNGPAGGDVYFEWQVERLALLRPGSRGPVYPDLLRGAGIEGTVLVQFVVDTLGRADLRTLQILQSEHAFFTSAVKRALEQMRFVPAEVGERKVPQLVQQTFQFRLDR
jgi:protein TonB